jgi:predicted lactoylglutathione lyase
MATQIFVNLPVRELGKSVEFYVPRAPGRAPGAC